jgi:hypothetical protein
MKRVNDPGIGYRVVMKITGIKGICDAGYECIVSINTQFIFSILTV